MMLRSVFLLLVCLFLTVGVTASISETKGLLDDFVPSGLTA
jgi:hypothetical protein